MTENPTDRLLDCGWCYEEQGEEVHPHPECPIGRVAAPAAVPPTGQTAARERVAAILRPHANLGGAPPRYEVPFFDGATPSLPRISGWRSLDDVADAVLAELPPPADRAAVLRDAAEQIVTADLGPRPGHSEAYANGWSDATLRAQSYLRMLADDPSRLAAEAPAPETQTALKQAHVALAEQAGRDQAALGRVRAVLAAALMPRYGGPQHNTPGGLPLTATAEEAALHRAQPLADAVLAVLPAPVGQGAEIERLREQLEVAEDTAEQLVRNVQSVARDRDGYRKAWKEEQQRRATAEAELRRLAGGTANSETEPHRPQPGDQFEAWLEKQRDLWDRDSPLWAVLAATLDNYRLHAASGRPLDEPDAGAGQDGAAS